MIKTGSYEPVFFIYRFDELAQTYNTAHSTLPYFDHPLLLIHLG